MLLCSSTRRCAERPISVSTGDGDRAASDFPARPNAGRWIASRVSNLWRGDRDLDGPHDRSARRTDASCQQQPNPDSLSTSEY